MFNNEAMERSNDKKITGGKNVDFLFKKYKH
jgi:hypothetical protein